VRRHDQVATGGGLLLAAAIAAPVLGEGFRSGEVRTPSDIGPRQAFDVEVSGRV